MSTTINTIIKSESKELNPMDFIQSIQDKWLVEDLLRGSIKRNKKRMDDIKKMGIPNIYAPGAITVMSEHIVRCEQMLWRLKQE